MAGRDVLFDVDWQGTQQLRQNARTDLVSIFILPPSRAELSGGRALALRTRKRWFAEEWRRPPTR